MPPRPAPLGEAGESGEAGEGGPATPASRRLLLDRMAAQVEGAAAARAAGDAESADILVAAATDEGPARLARRGDGADPALEAALAPLAAAPGDHAAIRAALRALDRALAAVPAATPVDRAARNSPRWHSTPSARRRNAAAWSTAPPMPRRRPWHGAPRAAALAGPAAREMAGKLAGLVALLPVEPPAALPAMGAVSALASQALLAASDAGR